MSACKGALILVLVWTIGALAAGCGWPGAMAGGEQLTLGYIEWDENVAISNLTKVVLEDEFGYEVELRVTNESVVMQVFRDVASGDISAFQDVWMPNHSSYLSEFEGDVEQLAPGSRGRPARVSPYPNIWTSAAWPISTGRGPT